MRKEDIKQRCNNIFFLQTQMYLHYCKSHCLIVDKYTQCTKTEMRLNMCEVPFNYK